MSIPCERRFKGVDRLFLLVPNVADELTQIILALAVVLEAGIKGIVYLCRCSRAWPMLTCRISRANTLNWSTLTRRGHRSAARSTRWLVRMA